MASKVLHCKCCSWVALLHRSLRLSFEENIYGTFWDGSCICICRAFQDAVQLGSLLLHLQDIFFFSGGTFGRALTEDLCSYADSRLCISAPGWQNLINKASQVNHVWTSTSLWIAKVQCSGLADASQELAGFCSSILREGHKIEVLVGGTGNIRDEETLLQTAI